MGIQVFKSGLDRSYWGWFLWCPNLSARGVYDPYMLLSIHSQLYLLSGFLRSITFDRQCKIKSVNFFISDVAYGSGGSRQKILLINISASRRCITIVLFDY